MSEPLQRVEWLRRRWQSTALNGGVQGIVYVALATAAIGAVCAIIALAVTLIY